MGLAGSLARYRFPHHPTASRSRSHHSYVEKDLFAGDGAFHPAIPAGKARLRDDYGERGLRLWYWEVLVQVRLHKVLLGPKERAPKKSDPVALPWKYGYSPQLEKQNVLYQSSPGECAGAVHLQECGLRGLENQQYHDEPTDKKR